MAATAKKQLKTMVDMVFLPCLVLRLKPPQVHMSKKSIRNSPTEKNDVRYEDIFSKEELNYFDWVHSVVTNG